MDKKTLRKLLHISIKLLFRVFTRTEIIGTENLPREGGYIIALNHLSWLDPPLAFIAVERQDFVGLVAKKYQRNPVMRILVNLLSSIWVDRNNPDYRALRTATKFLQEGGVLGIAPEGTRSLTRALIPAKQGTAFLAKKANVPIIPGAFVGTDNAERELWLLKRPRIQFILGQPFNLLPLDGKNREENLKSVADEIMCRIAVLLPPTYRGVYANHPRLKSFLEE